jgi:predicted GIY-YIG superfamily endonuclease
MQRKKRAPPQGPFCCYALQHSHSNRSYTGQTNNFERRLRQHNGALKGGARYTHTKTGIWTPIFRVVGFSTLRAVLQFEWAMKKRKVRSNGKNWRTRGPTGRVTQLEYLLSLGRLNAEEHSCFATNGIEVELCIPLQKYLSMACLTQAQFEMRRAQQGVEFKCTPK